MKTKDNANLQKHQKSTIGNTTSDKAFRDTKTQKRHQGLPNAGGVRTGQAKQEK